MGRALRVADALEAGMIWLNSENVRHLPTPFGGMKSSGIGRDGGDYSFDFYMETKHVSLARGTHKIQRLGTYPTQSLANPRTKDTACPSRNTSSIRHSTSSGPAMSCLTWWI